MKTLQNIQRQAGYQDEDEDFPDKIASLDELCV